ncbi:MAG: phosphoribosyltransferase [Promethearchaeota archaeon]
MATEFEVLHWDQCHELCFRIYQKVVESGYTPDVIIGLARGGWIPARILSDFFSKDLSTLRVEFYHGIEERDGAPRLTQPLAAYKAWRQPLVVDDIVDTGKSLKLALEHLKSLGFEEIRSACLHVKPQAETVPDFYMKETDAWVVYPWEVAEFTISLATLLRREKIPDDRIEERLLKFGLPETYIRYFYKRWLRRQSEG